MTTTIKHVTLKSLGKNKEIDPSKGTVTNPFTQEEYDSLCNTGEWPGGYVEAMGYVAPPMMDGMGDGSGSGSDGSSPYDDILNGILQSLPTALSNLITSGQVSVIFDPSLDVPGRYYKATSTIRIKPDSINIETIRHEMIHAYEHKQGYADGQSHTNNEYETYVINDLFFFIEHHGRFATGTISSNHEQRNAYCDFIEASINNTTWKVNTDYFISNVGSFFDAFRESHSNSPAGNGTTNSNYQWHWSELLTITGLAE